MLLKALEKLLKKLLGQLKKQQKVFGKLLLAEVLYVVNYVDKI